jgi:SAM-dependent methyltransferase
VLARVLAKAGGAHGAERPIRARLERMPHSTGGRQGEYGYDAPYALLAFAGIGIALLIAAVVSWWQHAGRATWILTGYAVFCLANAASFLYTTRRGKFVVWDRILDDLRLHGDEAVLDMGCGRGLVLIKVARRLTTGRATGIDLWSTTDQSSNAREATLQNAAVEGVADRIAVHTGDMRDLPFPPASFDLVVSSLAIHNIPGGAGRAQAVTEAWRVVRPGGRLAIADIRSTSGYARTLRELGAAGVVRTGLGWRFWYGNPMAGTSLVTASKPQGASVEPPARP